MKNYIKKATVRRNLDDLCEFVHTEIDMTDLEVDKVSIKKYTELKYDVIKNYTVAARFFKDNINNPEEFDKLYRKMKDILDDTPISVMVEHDDSIHCIILALGVNTDWLEQKDIVNSLTSKSVMVKFSL